MRKLIVAAALTAAVGLPAAAGAQSTAPHSQSTIVLVHGAFAESSSWNGVISVLSKRGMPVIAAANPLRGVEADARSVSAVVKSIAGPVVLAGHSYGGAVITEAANGNPNVMALVFVNAFAPDIGESALTLADKFPGSTLGATLTPVPLPGGGIDLYIQKEKFHAQFAADLPARQASLMAATQRPVAHAALAEPTRAPSWKRLPSYVIYGSADLCIPPTLSKFMAERAKARKVVEIDGASHALMVSHPDEVASLIEDAASAH
jgi:pimeloyl-ACP methyl ester carboxylesterase